MKAKKGFLIFLFLVSSAFVFAQKEDILLEEIIVKEHAERNSITPQIERDSTLVIAPKTAGEIFNHIPGFGITKRSSYSIEPNFRMFKREQLALMMDGGGQISQSCANRMDPMTSRISAGEIEKIEIIKGPYGVRFGQNFGGVVNIITDRPKRTGHFELHGSLEGVYESNSDGKSTIGHLAGVSEKIDVFLNGTYRDYGNYTSGGNSDEAVEILSSFKAWDYSGKLGFNPTTDQRLQVSLRRSFAEDVLHAGLPMDALSDEGNLLSVDYSWKPNGEKMKAINAKLYGSLVDHVMTNEWKKTFQFSYSLATVSSETKGGRLEVVTSPKTGMKLFSGFDYKYMGRDGTRVRELKKNPCTGLDATGTKIDPIWQNSSSVDMGVFTEMHQILSENTKLSAGLRLDQVQVDVIDPAAKILEYYNNDATPENKTLLNAFVTLDRQINKTQSVQVAIGRGTRNADLLEMYIHHMSVGKDVYEYVGNPHLEAEKNLQTEIAYNYQSEKLAVYSNVYYSYITDYITAFVNEDIPRLFTPCAQPAFVKQFINVDEVYQFGGELGFKAQLLANLHLQGDINYTQAHNKTWDEPVAEIAPMASRMKLVYTNNGLMANVGVQYVAPQDRVAASFNETTTPEYKLVDLGVQYKFKQLAQLGVQVDNLFNTKYYQHLSRAYKSLPETLMFYEPGRNIKVSLKVMF